MYHVVFDSSSVELLTAAMDMDSSLDGEIVLFQDDYAVGPIQDLNLESGRQNRVNWWSQIITIPDKEAASYPETSSDAEKFLTIIQRMKEEEFDEIWIWVAPNARDISGYYWLVSQLKDFSGRIFVLNLNNLPFINDKGAIFYPVSLSEIPAKEFIKAKKLVRVISSAEFETDPDEWIRLSAEQKNLRILEGAKKLAQKSDDFYDKTLLGFLLPTNQKFTRILNSFSAKSNTKPNELFLQWRLRQMSVEGILEQQGDAVRLFAKVEDEVQDNSVS